MPLYRYSAIDKGGARKSGEITAESEKDVKSSLKNMGLTVLTLDKKAGSAATVKGGAVAKKSGGLKALQRVTLKEITLFSRQLATMISSGASLLKSMTVLSEQNENPLFKSILEGVKSDLTAGIPLSTANSKIV